MKASITLYARPEIRSEESSAPGRRQSKASSSLGTRDEATRAVARTAPACTAGQAADRNRSRPRSASQATRSGARIGGSARSRSGTWRAGATMTPSACSCPQGTLAPCTAMMAATSMSPTPRTSSAWSASTGSCAGPRRAGGVRATAVRPGRAAAAPGTAWCRSPPPHPGRSPDGRCWPPSRGWPGHAAPPNPVAPAGPTARRCAAPPPPPVR
jgi:hypothetical protein